jgi:hypothetical protein
MSDYTTFQSQIADWANRQDWSPTLIASFISMAEQKFNAELRISRMIETAQGLITGRCAMLPDDWQEMDLVSIARTDAPNGWMPIRYRARDDFFKLPDKYAYGYYTIEGRELFFGGTPDAINGIEYLISYFGEVPVFADTGESWVYTKYPALYLNTALMYSYLYAVGEEQKAELAKQLAEDIIQKLNMQYAMSRASGSRLTRVRRRSFG